MKHLLRAVGLATAFAPAAVAAQSGHDHHPRPAPAAEKPSARSDGGTKATGAVAAPFRDYQPFRADEPRKDWRAANEEVRLSGGHIALMKEAASPAEHAGHRAAPAPQGAKK